MTHIESSEEQHPPGKPRPPIQIGITPDTPEQAVFRESPDGTYTIFLRGEIRLIVYPAAALQAPESPITGAETPDRGLVPESASPPVREPHSATESASQTENENRKFELIGNPVRDPSYRERRSGKKIADFVLATHPAEESTEYWRIRAFDRQAEKVRDQVRKGQTDVEATVYGPKHWISRRKTKEGWEDREVTGYYAGFVKVPKRYREGETHSGQ